MRLNAELCLEIYILLCTRITSATTDAVDGNFNFHDAYLYAFEMWGTKAKRQTMQKLHSIVYN
jgi:hypothetical protein